MAADLRADLRSGLIQLGLELSDRQQSQLLEYLRLIQKWSRVYNLTALREPAEILTHHLLDSLAVVAPLRRHMAGQGTSVLDVGAGAGLPGVVLAIACPELRVECVDAVAKKAAFVQQVAASLQLPNLRGTHRRVEELKADYDVIASRAFASLADFVNLTAHLLAPQGAWMAMKGKPPDAEVADLPPSVAVFHVEQLKVPGLDADRCLVWLGRPAP